MTLSSSVPIPETEARRAAVGRQIEAATGLNEAMVERLVRTFYETARRDEVIGHLFDHVQDWETHIANITAFWSSVALATGRYQGQPLPVHVALALNPSDFERWLALFERTAHAVCTPAAAALLMDKARRIARSLELGVAAGRGQLPSRSGPQG